MSIDIIIGERARSLPLHPCLPTCPARACDECCDAVRQEARPDAPEWTVMTAQGQRTGGFNFASVPIGYYYRWLQETGIAAAWPCLNPADMPSAIVIPDGLGAALHQLAVEIDLGIVPTSNPTDDAQFTCWFAWWALAAPRFYGLKAAIQFS